MLRGSINHITITVSDLDEAMQFYRPLLEFLGFLVPPDHAHPPVVCLSPATGSAFNLRPAREEFKDRKWEIWAPGLHHIAFNVESREQVEQVHALIPTIGGTVLDAPAEYPFTAVGTYYATYFTDPDGIKLECVHMSELERAYTQQNLLGKKLWGFDQA